MKTLFNAWLLAFVTLVMAHGVAADAPNQYTSPSVSARLIVAENGVAPGAGTLSVGLDLQMGDKWKSYWRSPGEVGLPTEIDWTGSENLRSAEILWPAPERFTAFGIENFGYSDRVVLPVRVLLDAPGEPATLQAFVSVLTCLDVCIPHDFELTLDIPAGTGINTDAAALITDYVARVPAAADQSDIALASATLDTDALVITARSDTPFVTPDVFPELGDGFSFGAPDIRLNDAGTELWASLPVLSDDDTVPELQVTLTDPGRALTASIAWTDTAPPPPFQTDAVLPDLAQMAFIALIALVGGLILNVMPCVLPVLSIKLASVMGHHDKPAHVVRTGFLMSALGVLSFMWVLAAAVLALQVFGVTVGWGLQFQNPVFLALMFLVLAIFSANLFGAFEISLPSSWQTRMANSGGREGYAGDFATGAFAAVLATPCSAPFLGTAIAFALTGRAIDVVVVFTALGLGLALPYLVFAARPSMVALLPKPGKWMLAVKTVLGGLLVMTAIWLLWVLSGVAGLLVAGLVLALAIGFVLVAAAPASLSRIRPALLGVLALAPLAVASGLSAPPSTAVASAHWSTFDRAEIPRLVSQGQVVFVDVTADWCLTCKANKALVLDRNPVVDLLQSDAITAMRADWTRPNEDIARFLESHGRFGIPFNIVYGPNAPDGIPLSELLTSAAVQDALSQAQTQAVASQ